MGDGNGDIKICQICGEGIWLSDEEVVVICQNCSEIVSFFEGGD